MAEEKSKEKKETSDRYEIVEVATQTAFVFHDKETNTNIDERQLLLQIANDISKLKRIL